VLKFHFIIPALLALSSCVGVSKTELTRAKTIVMDREQFAENPFGFELTPENVEKRYGKLLKKQRYFLQSPANEENTDIIYRFYKGKTKILFYKPEKLSAKLISGSIYHPDVKLKNEIHVGLSRKEFFWKFSDWLYDEAESLVLDSPATGNSFTFVFSRDRLKSIRISNSPGAAK
jgi:hypothetical protein